MITDLWNWGRSCILILASYLLGLLSFRSVDHRQSITFFDRCRWVCLSKTKRKRNRSEFYAKVVIKVNDHKQSRRNGTIRRWYKYTSPMAHKMKIISFDWLTYMGYHSFTRQGCVTMQTGEKISERNPSSSYRRNRTIVLVKTAWRFNLIDSFSLMQVSERPEDIRASISQRHIDYRDKC